MNPPRSGSRTMVPALVVGATGLLVLGVQPLLYGGYVHEGVIAEARLGTLAAVEISAIALGSVAGVQMLGRWRTQLVGLMGLALLIAGNLLPVETALFAWRTLAGAGAGMVVAIAAAQIARQVNVNEASGLFLFFQATSQYAILQGFTLLAPTASTQMVQAALAGISLLVLPVLFMVPARPSVASETYERLQSPPPAGWIALIASAMFLGSAIGIWAYLGVWLESAGVPADGVSARLTAALAGQIAGTLGAVALGTHRRSSLQVLASGTAMTLATALLLQHGPQGVVGWALMIGFGLAWMIGTPALSGLLLEVDPARRSLPYGASAQLVGAAIVPTAVGEIIAARGTDMVLAASAGLVALSLLAVGLALVARSAQRAI